MRIEDTNDPGTLRAGAELLLAEDTPFPTRKHPNLGREHSPVFCSQTPARQPAALSYLHTGAMMTQSQGSRSARSLGDGPVLYATKRCAGNRR